MLLELTRWLEQLQSTFGLFGYLTFRGILSALTALLLSLWIGPSVIRRLGQLKAGGQPIRTDGPIHSDSSSAVSAERMPRNVR